MLLSSRRLTPGRPVMGKSHDEEHRYRTAGSGLSGLAAKHRIERVDLVDRFHRLNPVHRLCGVDPVDRLGRLSGVHVLGLLGSELRLDLVRAIQLVPAGLAIDGQRRSAKPQEAKRGLAPHAWRGRANSDLRAAAAVTESAAAARVRNSASWAMLATRVPSRV